jgi:DNA-binding transcriptional MerR regulator
MNYITFICIACISTFSTLGYTIEGISPLDDEKNAGSVDECAPIVTTEDIQVLNDLSKDSTKYLTGRAKLSHKQVVAFQHLSEESSKCKVLIMMLINQPEVLLEVMETLSEQNAPNDPTAAQVQKVRHMELDLSGLTPPEKQVLEEISSPKPMIYRSSAENVSEMQWLVLQKYITLAAKNGGLTGFSNLERARILKFVAENIDEGFSIDDLDILRRAQLRALGFTEPEIARLSFLANQKDQDIPLTPSETATLKKWIEVESLPKSLNLMEFVELAAIHQLIQTLPNPPFTPSELSTDNKFFIRQLDNAPLADVMILSALKDLSDGISSYLGENKSFTPFQEMALKQFMISTLQFGRLPGINPDEVGSLLQLISLRVDLQGMMHSLKKARYVEMVIAGFSQNQSKILSRLTRRAFSENETPLTKEEIAVLKLYITHAKNPGGLNGFTVQERSSLFFTIEALANRRNSGFKPADLEILRRVEFRNNGFSNAEMHKFSLMVQQGRPLQDLSPEDLVLLNSLLQVENLVGRPSVLITPIESRFLNNVAKAVQRRQVEVQRQKQENRQAQQAEQQRIEQRRNQSFNQPSWQSGQAPGSQRAPNSRPMNSRY